MASSDPHSTTFLDASFRVEKIIEIKICVFLITFFFFQGLGRDFFYLHVCLTRHQPSADDRLLPGASRTLFLPLGSSSKCARYNYTRIILFNNGPQTTARAGGSRLGRGWGEGVVRETEIWTKKNFAAGSEEIFFTALQMFDPDLKKMGMFFCQLIFLRDSQT